MTISPSAEYAANIRAEMARRGLSQTELAARIDMGPSMLSRRLGGVIPFNVNELAAIAQALDVPLAILTEPLSVAAS